MFILMPWLLAIVCLVDSEAELEKRLRDEGYSKAEIEKILAQERLKKAAPPPETPPATDTELDEAKALEEALTQKLVELEVPPEDHPRHLKALLKLDEPGREEYLKKLGEKHKDEKWVEKQIKPLAQRLEDALWDGQELKDRLELEKGFWLKNLAQLREVDTGKVNTEEYDRLRRKFTRDLVDRYLKEAGVKNLSDEERIEFYDAAPTYIESKKDIREKKIKQVQGEIQAARVSERRTAMGKLRDKALTELKVYWAEKRTDPAARSARMDMVRRIFEDLVGCQDKNDFQGVLTASLRELTEAGFSRSEKDIVETYLNQIKFE